jgi:hypothetical protein
MTLLKNDNEGGRGLPIAKSVRKIGVFGSAGPPQAGLTGCEFLDSSQRSYSSRGHGLPCCSYTGGQAGYCYEDPATAQLREYPGRPNSTPNGTVTSGGGSGTVLRKFVFACTQLTLHM